MFGITLSGLDEYGTPGFRDAIERRQFEKHEVGILYSEKRLGTTRYPDYKLINRLFELPRVSLHLCGRAVYDLIRKGRVSNELESLINIADRVQLNISATEWSPKTVAKNLNSVNSAMAWIIQFRENSLDNCVEIADLLFNPHFLFDSSGGRGELPDSWPTIDLPNMGAAGGLNPENIRANLDLMRERGYIRDGFWIDVESGVRTDDKWDWDKARAFVENTEDAQSIMEVVPRSASI